MVNHNIKIITTSTKVNIYETKTAPNPRRVRIFLAEKSIEANYIQLDIAKGENLTPEMRSKNPSTKVPFLELDDGTCIGETVAICRYFEELNPENPLFGKTPLEKAQVEMWQRQTEFYFLMSVGMCFQHSTGYFQDRMIPVQEWGAESGKNAVKFLRTLNAQLEANSYLAGEEFSIADITLLCALDFARVVKIKPDPDKHPHILEWYQRISQRPSVQA